MVLIYPPRTPISSCPLNYISETTVSKSSEFLSKKQVVLLRYTVCSFTPEDAIHKGHNIGRCTRCNKTTCIMCKGSFHKDECPEDALKQLMNKAKGKNGKNVEYATTLSRLQQVATI